MDALILSCGTGGGHNSAGKAVCEELKKRGNRAEFLDPFTLRSDGLSTAVSMAYIKMAQRLPRAFGACYGLAELIRRIPGRSPVYFANRRTARSLAKHLAQNHYDVVITPHLFPAEMLTYIKKHGGLEPLAVFVATDYACIPFTEETECDYYVIPGEALREEFKGRGIPEEKLRAFGIPAAGEHYEPGEKQAAKQALGLREDRDYVLLAGGSIGAGKLFQAAKTLKRYYAEHGGKTLIVVCGNNEKLRRRLRGLEDDRLIVLGQTDRMPLYLKASDLFLSKAGGISSTEAAVQKVPFIQIPSIPGCETINRRYFSENGMSLAVKKTGEELENAVRRLEDPAAVREMLAAQETGVPRDALFRLCDWLEEICAER